MSRWPGYSTLSKRRTWTVTLVRVRPRLSASHKLDSAEQTLYLEQEIERFLNIKDAPVVGRCGHDTRKRCSLSQGRLSARVDQSRQEAS